MISSVFTKQTVIDAGADQPSPASMTKYRIWGQLEQPFGSTKFSGGGTIGMACGPDPLYMNFTIILSILVRIYSSKASTKKDTGTSILAPLDEDPGLHGINICNL